MATIVLPDQQKIEGFDDTIAGSDDQLRDALVSYVPEIRNADLKRETKDGLMTVRVIKKAGTKGAEEKCPDCNCILIGQDDRDEDGNVSEAWLECERCGYSRPITIKKLTFQKVSEINLQRALLWHKGGLEEWSVSDWAVAMMGEAGEACDAIKKLRRIEESVASKNASQPVDREAAIKAIEQEIGDTFIYLDLLAQRLGINIEDAIRNTFNRISEREGFTHRL